MSDLSESNNPNPEQPASPNPDVRRPPCLSIIIVAAIVVVIVGLAVIYLYNRPKPTAGDSITLTVTTRFDTTQDLQEPPQETASPVPVPT